MGRHFWHSLILLLLLLLDGVFSDGFLSEPLHCEVLLFVISHLQVQADDANQLKKNHPVEEVAKVVVESLPRRVENQADLQNKGDIEDHTREIEVVIIGSFLLFEPCVSLRYRQTQQ